MKIAIVGYGVEGKSAYTYFKQKYPDASFAVYDESNHVLSAPDDVEKHVGISIGEITIQADIVVRSPSVNPSHITTDGKVTSVTKEFFEQCPAPIIGITGTKGKGTTASLIHSILTAAGKKSWLLGNIGVPSLDVVDQISKDDIVVYELSSFQLWDLDTSPSTSVVLMVEPDHLDIHESFSDYVEAKANIRRYQSADDVCVYDPENEYSEYIAHKVVNESVAQAAMSFADSETSVVYVKENTFFVQGDPICSVDSLQLIGQHNVRNACAAITATLKYIDDYSVIETGLRNFDGLPHRLKFVATVNDVKYIDDSIATTPGSAIAAIRSFDAPKILILGGSNKGAQFDDLYEAILNSDIKRVIAIGVMGDKIAHDLQERGYSNVTNLGSTTMDTIVSTAQGVAEPGDVVIMSPACASFDMFKSYVDRGEQFVAAVNVLG